MMDEQIRIEERGSTHVYRQIKMLSEEELVLRENRCVYEQPAYCVAACPLKLDTKAFMDAAAKGQIDKALQLYEKIAPFPAVLAAGCEAPCERKCKLCELGEGVAVRDVEQAVVRFGKRPVVKGFLRMKKKQTVVLFGSGLFILFLTGELVKKNYPVTLICPQKDRESWLRAAADPAGLPEAAVLHDAGLLEKMDLTFRGEEMPDAQQIREAAETYNAVCVSPSLVRSLFPESETDEAVMYDRNLRLVTAPSACDAGVLAAAEAAKRAALSVDRIVQKLDPSNMRGTEGAVETRLYTNLEKV
ncbi:MAG: aldehyde dehydrogenase, partial [Oscillospiraceae bacterium]|nr:aldehyde dehydrogenase [Oscillospiraceae bacterium]